MGAHPVGRGGRAAAVPGLADTPSGQGTSTKCGTWRGRTTVKSVIQCGDLLDASLLRDGDHRCVSDAQALPSVQIGILVQ